MDYGIQRKSDGSILESRNTKPYAKSKIPAGCVAVSGKRLAAGGKLVGKTFTPKAPDTAGQAERAAIIENFKALDPTAHGEPLNTIIKYLQR